ncbi:MAG: hypothetical protein CM1200mP24_04120 [Gammaproteobacteria bacterium]|nr:MAG: hypothetical protein CM1200mP24_04120 [Gammaproteobacteria bacterium]
MNSKVVVGIGNIYANETLFRSGIRPGIAADALIENATTESLMNQKII